MERQLKFKDLRQDLETYLEKVEQNRHPISFILDQVTDVRNLGLIFRLADAARVAHIYILPDTTTYNESKFTKVARKTEEFVPWSILRSVDDMMQLKQNLELVALEITNQSFPYHRFDWKGPLGLVIGNEQRGIRQEVLQLCDRSIHIIRLLQYSNYQRRSNRLRK